MFLCHQGCVSLFLTLFFMFFPGWGLQSVFSAPYYAARPFSGRPLFGNGTAQCDVREPGSSPAPRSHPRGLGSRGLLNSRNLNRQVELFATESLILAQNERWRHGLGMQVGRPGLRPGEWRKGAQRVGNLPPGPGQALETASDTGWGPAWHQAASKDSSPGEGPASH